MCNIVLAYVVYFACRVAYIWENWNLFAEGWKDLSLWQLTAGGLRFDTAAIAYTNILYALLMFLPAKVRDHSWWQTMCKWIFVVVNSLAVVINLCDSVYSQYTGRRTTNTFFREFSNDGNLGTIFFTELLNHWYLVLVGAALIALLWFCYVRVAPSTDAQTNPDGDRRSGALRYYLMNSLLCILLLAAAVVGIRGGLMFRPLSISYANQYVNRPEEYNIVLNTPYTLIRTIGKTTYKDPHYMSDEEMLSVYSPLHNAAATPDTMLNRKNVVFLIVESFGQEYFGFHNKELEPGYTGYTPFLDSLISVSMTWENTFANGRKSIHATPALLASIPMFVEPFFFSGYSLNKLDGIATLLNREGYQTAFFHGASNGSMNFESF
jgi:phosphoglycerol transferase MdoB-like AlkP superfamily enzyme